jgi:hypothetical protein
MSHKKPLYFVYEIHEVPKRKWSLMEALGLSREPSIHIVASESRILLTEAPSIADEYVAMSKRHFPDRKLRIDRVYLDDEDWSRITWQMEYGEKAGKRWTVKETTEKA